MIKEHFLIFNTAELEACADGDPRNSSVQTSSVHNLRKYVTCTLHAS